MILRQDVGYGVVGLWLMLIAAGCGTPQTRRSPQLAALATKLDVIETTQLAQQSKSPPVSIEQATEKLATQIVEPNETQRVVRLSPDEVRAAALANRMELVDLEYQLAANEIGVELAKNDLLPELDLSYRFSAGGQAADEERALENLFRDNSTDHRVGLAATIPLGNRAAKARLREARLQRVRTALNRELQEQQIRQEVYEAVDGLEQNWRRILAAEQGVVRADRSYRVEQLRFQLGQRTSVEVLDAASNLADAQLRKISAFASYEIAQIYLARATGTLLGYGRICLEPYGSALPGGSWHLQSCPWANPLYLSQGAIKSSKSSRHRRGQRYNHSMARQRAGRVQMEVSDQYQFNLRSGL